MAHQNTAVDWLVFKDALWSLGERCLVRKKDLHWLMFLCLNKLNKQTFFVLMTVSYCFTLLICGGPCHLSCFKKCSKGPYSPLSTACLFFCETIYIFLGLYYYLINIVIVPLEHRYISYDGGMIMKLHSLTTWCLFIIFGTVQVKAAFLSYHIFGKIIAAKNGGLHCNY